MLRRTKPAKAGGNGVSKDEFARRPLPLGDDKVMRPALTGSEANPTVSLRGRFEGVWRR